jgi:methylthioribose-1-phosphate isomerase
MKIDGTPYRSIWVDETDSWSVRIIDQTKLPWALDLVRITDMDTMAHAIKAMLVRGAPLIGASAAYGVALAMRADPSDANLANALAVLGETRPTAINLRWALARMRAALQPLRPNARAGTAYAEAAAICDEDVATNKSIGAHGLPLIAARAENGRRVNILTHCNAGWIATVDWGTALAPIYMAHDSGLNVHVWVEETRPRNQGASLTAWELGKHGVPHTVITDNAGGHMMQRGDVDLVIVGTDRVTRAGDVANKIGTYLKALAARDNGVPFWVALPSTTIDWTISDGLTDIPIEERPASEVTTMTGRALDGSIATVRIVPTSSPAANPAFDVTPARLVSGLITERGLCDANEAALSEMFKDISGKEASVAKELA